MKKLIVITIVCTFMVVPANGDYIYNFAQISSNPTDYLPSQIAQQLSVTVADEGSNKVSFTFSNTAVIQSVITGIYFDDTVGILSPLTDAGISDSGDDVAFVLKLKNFPDAPLFFNETDSVLANSPPPDNGINNSDDWVKLTFAYTGTFTNLIDQINAGWMGPSDTLRIGLHVQSIPYTGGTKSNSFILVPLPATILLGLLGLGVGGLKLRKTMK